MATDRATSLYGPIRAADGHHRTLVAGRTMQNAFLVQAEPVTTYFIVPTSLTW